MSFTIRRLDAADLVAYRAIRQEALEKHPEAFLSTAEDFARMSDAEVEKAFDTLAIFGAVLPDGTLGGINALLRKNGDREQHKGLMIQVYVRSEQRGTGMARALVEHLVEHARDEVLQIHLGVWSENVPAIKLYESLGFEIYATEPRYMYVNGRYVDEHLMVRFLDKAAS